MNVSPVNVCTPGPLLGSMTGFDVSGTQSARCDPLQTISTPAAALVTLMTQRSYVAWPRKREGAMNPHHRSVVAGTWCVHESGPLPTRTARPEMRRRLLAEAMGAARAVSTGASLDPPSWFTVDGE